MLTFTQKIKACGITAPEATEKKPRKTRKDRRPENPEKLSKCARREFLQEIAAMDSERRFYLDKLLNAAANASLWSIEKQLHRLRLEQATNDFLFTLWDLIVDLERRIPTAEELEQVAETTREKYHLTPESWNWKNALKEAIRYRQGFEKVRDLFQF